MLQRPPSRRSRHAQWQRDYRARERTGVKIAPAPYDGQVDDFLVRIHWPDPAVADDQRVAGAALFELGLSVQFNGAVTMSVPGCA